MQPDLDPDLATARGAIRHFLISLAHRFGHVSGGAPDDFGDFEAGSGVRTPRELVRHMTRMLLLVRQRFEPEVGTDPAPLPWPEERARFLAEVRDLDRALAGGAEPSEGWPLGQLWRGPLIDAMTHVGQLATLRRLAGAPVERAGYARAEMAPLDRDPASRDPQDPRPRDASSPDPSGGPSEG